MALLLEETLRRWRAEANNLDAADEMAGFAERFARPTNGIYLDGNSLGLMSDVAQESVKNLLAEWGNEAIAGWKLGGWFDLAERLGERVGALIGARLGETLVTGSTTVNLHQLLATFFQPTKTRRRILTDATAFPTDLHAIRSHLRLRGCAEDARLVMPNVEGLLKTETILAAMDESVALAVLPAVVYTTGQLLDLAEITAGARKRGLRVIWDCSHSIGAVKHDFARDAVELAVWCSYKYLNGGPGAVGGLYVAHNLWSGFSPGMAGWWGGKKERMFAMSGVHEPADGAAGLQIGTPHLFSMAALAGSLSLFEEVGMDEIRRKSLALTAFLREMIAEYLPECEVATPPGDGERGGHLALRMAHAREICHYLRASGRVIGDFRPPDILRLAPVAFYNSFAELVETVGAIRKTLDSGAHLVSNPDILLVT